METMQLPPGYRFVPTEEDLILDYLLKKAKGEALPCDVVKDCEVLYDKEPWKIFDENSTEKFYVFTKLKKKNGRGKRIERKVGCGTWKGEGTEIVKDSKHNRIGFNQPFVFEVKDSGSSSAATVHGNWLMREFSLVNDQSDYVLCVVRNKSATGQIQVREEVQSFTPELSQTLQSEHNWHQPERVPYSNSSTGGEDQNYFLSAATGHVQVPEEEDENFAAELEDMLSETGKVQPFSDRHQTTTPEASQPLPSEDNWVPCSNSSTGEDQNYFISEATAGHVQLLEEEDENYGFTAAELEVLFSEAGEVQPFSDWHQTITPGVSQTLEIEDDWHKPKRMRYSNSSTGEDQLQNYFISAAAGYSYYNFYGES